MERKIIQESIYIDMLEGTFDEIRNRLDEFEEQYPNAVNPRIEVDQWYEDITTYFRFDRFETDEELDIRRKRSARAKAAYQRRKEKQILKALESQARQEDEEKALYKKLKEKYG